MYRLILIYEIFRENVEGDYDLTTCYDKLVVKNQTIKAVHFYANKFVQHVEEEDGGIQGRCRDNRNEKL